MSNPTRQEIVKAHEALTHLIDYDLADAYTEAEAEEVYEREQLIRKFLPPIPQPTMAEVVWDDAEHYLAEAENENGDAVIMLGKDASGRINIVGKGFVGSVYTNLLTPTGKRYTLTEVQDG